MILCADDYGLREDIDRAILELTLGGRLSAISCMVVFDRCSRTVLAELLQHQAHVDIGLHLCLTDEGLPLSPTPQLSGKRLPSFAPLVRQALSHRMHSAEMASHIALQYDLFVEKCGRPPDFMDGHLHVHQLPGVREELIKFALSLPAAERPYIRNTNMSLPELRKRRLPWLKAGFLARFGRRMFQQLHAAKLPTNRGFAGIYNFRQSRRYDQYLPGFLQCLSEENGIMVVHPGTDDLWRREEFMALRKFTFPGGLPNRFKREREK